MAEVKSRKNSGTLRRESDLKDQDNTWTRGNDYGLILRQQTIMPARGRDIREDEKIVWTAANTKLQNVRIKSRADNNSIPYQRGARAIARQVNRETRGRANMSPDEAQGLINNWYARYARVRTYVGRCDRAVRKPPHWIQNPWGRRRRFYESPSESVMAAQIRECVNFPIQSTVAEALSRALFNCYAFRRENPQYNFKILLAIHDAILFDVPVEILEPFMDVVLPTCMVRGVEIPPCPRFGSSSFKLDIDPEVLLRWGEKPARAHLEEMGVSERFLPSVA